MREDAVLALIEGMRDEAIAFLQDFTRIDTANPPGDTQAGAAFIADFLSARG